MNTDNMIQTLDSWYNTNNCTIIQINFSGSVRCIITVKVYTVVTSGSVFLGTIVGFSVQLSLCVLFNDLSLIYNGHLVSSWLYAFIVA